MGIMKTILTAIVFAIILPFSLVGGWAMYKMWSDYYYKGPILSPEQKFDQAFRKCLIAEAAEGAASQNDQVLIVTAMMRVAKERNVDPCWLFTRYTLMRAPNQELAFAWPRDPDFVLGKSEWLEAASSRTATATKVVDRVLKGEIPFESGEPQEIELQRRRMLSCVTKYHRVWRVNTARTDIAAIRTAMGQSWKSPAGTEFFCPK